MITKWIEWIIQTRIIFPFADAIYGVVNVPMLAWGGLQSTLSTAINHAADHGELFCLFRREVLIGILHLVHVVASDAQSAVDRAIEAFDLDVRVYTSSGEDVNTAIDDPVVRDVDGDPVAVEKRAFHAVAGDFHQAHIARIGTDLAQPTELISHAIASFDELGYDGTVST
jgi:hypothetical protein